MQVFYFILLVRRALRTESLYRMIGPLILQGDWCPDVEKIKGLDLRRKETVIAVKLVYSCSDQWNRMPFDLVSLQCSRLQAAFRFLSTYRVAQKRKTNNQHMKAFSRSDETDFSSSKCQEQ